MPSLAPQPSATAPPTASNCPNRFVSQVQPPMQLPLEPPEPPPNPPPLKQRTVSGAVPGTRGGVGGLTAFPHASDRLTRLSTLDSATLSRDRSRFLGRCTLLRRSVARSPAEMRGGSGLVLGVGGGSGSGM